MASLSRWRRGARRRGRIVPRRLSRSLTRSKGSHADLVPTFPTRAAFARGALQTWSRFDDTHIPDDDHWMTYFQDDAQFKIHRCDSCDPLNVARLAAQRRRAATRTACICQGCSADVSISDSHLPSGDLAFAFFRGDPTHTIHCCDSCDLSAVQDGQMDLAGGDAPSDEAALEGAEDRGEQVGSVVDSVRSVMRFYSEEQREMLENMLQRGWPHREEGSLCPVCDLSECLGDLAGWKCVRPSGTPGRYV